MDATQSTPRLSKAQRWMLRWLRAHGEMYPHGSQWLTYDKLKAMGLVRREMEFPDGTVAGAVLLSDEGRKVAENA